MACVGGKVAGYIEIVCENDVDVAERSRDLTLKQIDHQIDTKACVIRVRFGDDPHRENDSTELIAFLPLAATVTRDGDSAMTMENVERVAQSRLDNVPAAKAWTE